MDRAKVFMTGRSQAVRIPKAYRFDSDEVTIEKLPDGAVVLRPPKRKGLGERLWEALGPEPLPDFERPPQGELERDAGMVGCSGVQARGIETRAQGGSSEGAPLMRLLDTNICVHVIRRRPPAVRERLTEAEAEGEGLALSIVTAMELEVGARRSEGTEYARQVAVLLSSVEIIALDDSARVGYGALRHDLERRGLVIGPLDMLIAAHALALDATVVTNNEREFKRVKGLRVENWAR